MENKEVLVWFVSVLETGCSAVLFLVLPFVLLMFVFFLIDEGFNRSV